MCKSEPDKLHSKIQHVATQALLQPGRSEYLTRAIQRRRGAAAAIPQSVRNQCAISAARRARLAGFGKFPYRPFKRPFKEPFKGPFTGPFKAAF